MESWHLCACAIKYLQNFPKSYAASRGFFTTAQLSCFCVPLVGSWHHRITSRFQNAHFVISAPFFIKKGICNHCDATSVVERVHAASMALHAKFVVSASLCWILAKKIVRRPRGSVCWPAAGFVACCLSCVSCAKICGKPKAKIVCLNEKEHLLRLATIHHVTDDRRQTQHCTNSATVSTVG